MNLVANIEKAQRDESNPFLEELVRQIRIQDNSGTYSNCSNELLLKSLIVSQDCQIGDREVDSLTQLQVSAFYHAVAARVEKETGQLAETFINLSHKGLSTALVCCGPLLVVNKLLRGVQCFGFESLERLVQEGEKLTEAGVAKAREYFDFSAISSTHVQQGEMS